MFETYRRLQSCHANDGVNTPRLYIAGPATSASTWPSTRLYVPGDAATQATIDGTTASGKLSMWSVAQAELDMVRQKVEYIIPALICSAITTLHLVTCFDPSVTIKNTGTAGIGNGPGQN